MPSEPVLATQIFSDMIEALRAEDFRLGPQYSAPWECFGPDPEASNNPLFLASVALPYSVLKNLPAE